MIEREGAGSDMPDSRCRHLADSRPADLSGRADRQGAGDRYLGRPFEPAESPGTALAQLGDQTFIRDR